MNWYNRFNNLLFLFFEQDIVPKKKPELQAIFKVATFSICIPEIDHYRSFYLTISEELRRFANYTEIKILSRASRGNLWYGFHNLWNDSFSFAPSWDLRRNSWTNNDANELVVLVRTSHYMHSNYSSYPMPRDLLRKRKKSEKNISHIRYCA